MEMLTTPDDGSDLTIKNLGPCRIESPLKDQLCGEFVSHFVRDDERVLLHDRLSEVGEDCRTLMDLPSLELAGPREHIYFDPSKVRCGIVTCGGLCPGLNDVIRGLVMQLWHRYGVRRIYGFRYGYQGFIAKYGHDVLDLTPQTVLTVHEAGGTFLGSSRGPQSVVEIVDCIERMGIGILFPIGGDGTMRGGLAIAEEIEKRGMKTAVVGIPKTIDNDIMFIDQSFGFQTAYSEGVESIRAAHVEAAGAPNGVGLVKLMGRHSGFIACFAALAAGEANFVLIPEIPIDLEGPRGFLALLEKRLKSRGHAVVVVAEGAGQELMMARPDETMELDLSGNKKLKDIGVYFKQKIGQHFGEKGMDITLKYIDPSYNIRSIPASPSDSIYCWRLAQNAVHAAMCGKTEMVLGRWHGSLVHVPTKRCVSGRKQVDPHGELWLSVIEDTGQPVSWANNGT